MPAPPSTPVAQFDPNTLNYATRTQYNSLMQAFGASEPGSEQRAAAARGINAIVTGDEEATTLDWIDETEVTRTGGKRPRGIPKKDKPAKKTKKPKKEKKDKKDKEGETKKK
jgi:hypothetical protein